VLTNFLLCILAAMIQIQTFLQLLKQAIENHLMDAHTALIAANYQLRLAVKNSDTFLNPMIFAQN